MDGFLATAMMVTMGLVLLVLLAGIVVMARGGKVAQRYSNVLMRWRVGLQAAAVVLFLLLLLVIKR